MDINFLIDYREKKILSFFEKLKDNINYSSKNLEIGDIIFEIKKNKKVVYEIIIERKGITDLISSIKDNRYKNQKSRLIEYKNNSKINIDFFYLIEGSTQNLISDKKSLSMYHGSLISMLLRDNIKLIFSNNINETNLLLERLYNRISKKPVDFLNINSELNKMNDKMKSENSNMLIQQTELVDSSYVKKKKSDNITSNNCGSLMLTYIPGVSINLATEILGHFDHSIVKLISYLIVEKESKAMDDIIKDLGNIKIKTKTNKERRIGNAIASKIIEYLKLNV